MGMDKYGCAARYPGLVMRLISVFLLRLPFRYLQQNIRLARRRSDTHDVGAPIGLLRVAGGRGRFGNPTSTTETPMNPDSAVHDIKSEMQTYRSESHRSQPRAGCRLHGIRSLQVGTASARKPSRSTVLCVAAHRLRCRRNTRPTRS